MCAFKYCKVKSDKILLKKDGIVAYKVLHKVGKNRFRSEIKQTLWNNGRMTLRSDTKMHLVPNGRGPGIYAWKKPPDIAGHYGGTVVKILLYGRVIEYAAFKSEGYSRQAGYMAQRAEILEVL